MTLWRSIIREDQSDYKLLLRKKIAATTDSGKEARAGFELACVEGAAAHFSLPMAAASSFIVLRNATGS